MPIVPDMSTHPRIAVQSRTPKTTIAGFEGCVVERTVMQGS